MEIIKSVTKMQKRASDLRQAGYRLGLVPTMGHLHEGHLSLVDIAKDQSDYAMISIFVNPTQFDEGEDYNEYPRDLDRDIDIAKDRGVDLTFVPPVSEMYPEGYRTYITVEGLSEVLCGASRPNHFRGVTTVVTKLFNIMHPHLTVFGQKDAQQAVIIRRLINDLNLEIELLLGPVIREPDGLAMSSRNTYLSEEERTQALCLSTGLRTAKKMVETGETDSNIILEEIRSIIDENPDIRKDYVEAVDLHSLEPVNSIEQPTLIAVAAYAGTTRLIDNIIVRDYESNDLKIEDTSRDNHRGRSEL